MQRVVPPRAEQPNLRVRAGQVAIPSASAAQKRTLIARIEAVGLPVKILPGLVEMVDGHADMAQIREVDVADLLGRDPVAPAAALFLRNITGKVVMVTGPADQ